MKRVYCLYRVSTKGQVDKDDIPMQRSACQDFAERNGWTILKEFSEKGVSGFKVSAENRDAIQELKAAAEKREFDILLVFMFDRIGRISNETPFVVEWFANQGIEVWSTQEGRQQFENDTDHLMNFIRYWQANGESKKTSARVKTRLHQLVEESRYTGGVTPYGYKLEKSGEITKKNKELMKLVIETEEAEIVKEIFNKTVYEGYGSHMLAEELNRRGLKTHNGARFQSNNINRMLGNKIYCGYYVLGDTISPMQEEIRIVDEEIFQRASYILEQRKQVNEKKRHIALSNKGHTLLSGNIFCGHCGDRLKSSVKYETYTNKQGEYTRTKTYRYICVDKIRKLNDCDGQTGYIAHKVDKAVEELVIQYLEMIRETPKDMAIERRYKAEIKGLKTRRLNLMKEQEKLAEQISKLSQEVAKSIVGESKFTPETLAMSIDITKKKQAEAEKALIEVQSKIKKQEESIGNIDGYYNEFISWAEEYRTATLEQKKMIVCHLIKSIKIYRGYKIEVEFNMNYEQFI